MPVPQNLNVHQAVKLQRQIMDRLINIYAKNSIDVDDVYKVHKVCQCVADDEFFAETGLEPEQIETFIYLNKQMVLEMRSDRSVSYDYMQQNDDKDGDEGDENES